MSKTKVLFGKEARDGLLKGMNVIAKAVTSTMGAAGKNAMYRSDYSNAPVATNDGITIARRINLEDEVEAMGAEFLTQPADRTNEEVGDATSTCIALTHAMCQKGAEKVDAGKNAMTLRKEMQESAERITAFLKESATPIKTDEELFNIANISMENPEIAQIIAEAVKKVGENGIVIVEESSGIKIERKDIDGLKFDKGYLTPYMATNPSTMECILEDVHILVTDKQFQMNKDLMPLLDEMVTKHNVRKLLIICSGMNGEILSTCIANRMQNKFHCVVVEKPYDTEMLEDIAILTGAENVTNAKYPGDAVVLKYGWLGKAEKIVVDAKSTLIIGGAGNQDKVDERVEVIKKSIEESEGSYTKERLKERLAKLVGGVVILQVGAPTEADMKYMKLKVDDAVASTRAALQEGIVVGGGKTLYNISLQPVLSEGDEVVKYACGLPMKHIMKNAGFTGKVVGEEVFNALTWKLTSNPIADGIIDPVKAERCALNNAVSSAGIFVTTETLIIDIKEKKTENML